MGWGEFKPLLTETAINALKPIQDKYQEIMDRKGIFRVSIASKEEKKRKRLPIKL